MSVTQPDSVEEPVSTRVGPSPRITAVYRVTSTADAIERRARALAVEQSVEMPLEAISDTAVLDHVVGQVAGIDDLGGGVFQVRVDLASATTGLEPGQLLNMLFGNASMFGEVARG